MNVDILDTPLKPMAGNDDDDDVSFDDVTEVLPKHRQAALISDAIRPPMPPTPTGMHIVDEPTMMLPDDGTLDAWDDATETLSVDAQSQLLSAPALPFQQRALPTAQNVEDPPTEQWTDVTEQLSPAEQARRGTAPTLPFNAGPSTLPDASTPRQTSAATPFVRRIDPDDDDLIRFDDQTEHLSLTAHLIAAHSELLPFAPASFVGISSSDPFADSISSSASIAAQTIHADPTPAPKASRFFHRVAAPGISQTTALVTALEPRQTDAIPLVHDSNISVFTFPWMFQGNRCLRTVVVKMTCDIISDDVAQIRDEPDFPLGDVFRDDDRAQSLLYASDFVPQKPKVDVTLVGHATTTGPAVDSAIVEFRFGNPAQGGFERKIRIHGQRRFERAANGTVSPGKPTTWTRIPLVYEHAFGGTDCPDNPVGIGKDGIFAPQLDHLSRLVRTPSSTIDAACFGPVSPSWPVRHTKIGTFDASWSAKRWPSMPVDHDWAYWQSAPTQQQLDLARGDETFVLVGVHPKYGVIDGRLPGRTARCFADRNGHLYEVALRLDTIAFDADKMKIDMIFRGSMEVADDDATDVAAVFVTMEPVEGPSLSLDEVYARYRAKQDLLAAASSEPLAKPANDQSLETFAPRQTSIETALAAGGAVSLGALPEAHASEQPANPVPPPEQLDQTARRMVEARIAQSETLAELDLENADLSGMDLSGQIFTRTNMRRANLRGAKLEDADLTDVKAANAVFKDVKAARVQLDRADLTDCNFDGADLQEASIDETNLTNVHATGANFRRTRGEGVQFVHASLGFAAFDHAELPKADFSSAVLENASFAHARIVDVRFYDAAGHAIAFDETIMTGARADGTKFEHASFVGAEVSGSVWDKAKLSDTKWSWATLAHASFQRAELDRAVFSSARLMHATFRKAHLVDAVFDKANLMHASLESADLTGAVLRDANLYGAETWRAKLERTDLSRSLMQKSKLGGQAK